MKIFMIVCVALLAVGTLQTIAYDPRVHNPYGSYGRPSIFRPDGWIG